MSLALATQEAIWINRLLSELKLEKEAPKPVTVYEDNQSAICILSFMDEVNMWILSITLSEMKQEKEILISNTAGQKIWLLT